MTSSSDTIAPASNVVARKVGEDMVLLDLESGQYFGLDTVGSRFWELLEDSPKTLDELTNVIYAEFDAPRDQIGQDLLVLANALAEKHLIISR